MSKREKTPGIYRITNLTNNRVYIGSTKNIPQRFKQYMTAVETVTKNPSKASKYNEIINDIATLGWNNFKFEIIDASADMYDNSLRAIREIEMITKYRSIIPKYGYNATMGGETGTTKHKAFNTGKPKDLILVDTEKKYRALLYLRGSSTIHEDLGIARSSVPDAARNGSFIKGRYFIFFAETEHRETVAEYVKLKRDMIKSNGKNDNNAKKQYAMYLEALESANECAKMFGY